MVLTDSLMLFSLCYFSPYCFNNFCLFIKSGVQIKHVGDGECQDAQTHHKVLKLNMLCIMPKGNNLSRFVLKLKVSYTEPSTALKKRETLKCVKHKSGFEVKLLLIGT